LKESLFVVLFLTGHQFWCETMEFVMELTTPFQNFQNVLCNISGQSSDGLISMISQCGLDKKLERSICEAVKGDNRQLNAWLFSEGMKAGQIIAWIAPVKFGHSKYVWMIGHQTISAIMVHKWFTGSREALSSDALLKQKLVSPPLLFVEPVAVSKVTKSDLGHQDEFAIFQTGYADAPAEVNDLEQRMVINTTYAVSKRKEALLRLVQIVDDPNHPVIECLAQNLELFSVLHNEGHNQGHFVGEWPHEDVIKKNCIMYEAVEEFRACLAAVLLAEHLPISDLQKEAFALSVFVVRFLGFGYEAYHLKSHRRETVREVTVGLMFFEWLVINNVVTPNSKGLSINYSNLRESLRNAFIRISDAEARVTERSQAELKQIAVFWYKIAFPNRDYSLFAKSVYDEIGCERSKIYDQN
jgi:hypothetical protein